MNESTNQLINQQNASRMDTQCKNDNTDLIKGSITELNFVCLLSILIVFKQLPIHNEPQS